MIKGFFIWRNRACRNTAFAQKTAFNLSLRHNGVPPCLANHMSGPKYVALPPKTRYAPIWWQMSVLLVFACIYVALFLMMLKVFVIFLVFVAYPAIRWALLGIRKPYRAIVYYNNVGMAYIFQGIIVTIEWIVRCAIWLIKEPEEADMTIVDDIIEVFSAFFDIFWGPIRIVQTKYIS